MTISLFGSATSGLAVTLKREMWLMPWLNAPPGAVRELLDAGKGTRSGRRNPRSNAQPN